jgi:hypothetical protein
MRTMISGNRNAVISRLGAAAVAALMLAFAPRLQAEDRQIAKRLDGFDAYMQKVLKDWNAPGVGVVIVLNDKLVFAKGYGYKELELYQKQCGVGTNAGSLRVGTVTRSVSTKSDRSRH